MNPKRTTPLTMPTPIPGNTMHLITVIPTISGSCFPTPFKPEQQQQHRIFCITYYESEFYMNRK